jgi:RNA polymerase sigma-70 factor (ECF subfamily)
MQLLTGEQHSLYRYITALTGDPDEAGNILQETNLVIWRKAADFTLGGNFGAWARSIALWQVKAWLRDRRRDRHIFSFELIGQLAERPAAFADIGPRRQALRKCVTVLQEDERELLRQRYCEGFSILEIAKRFQKTPSAVKSGLFRVRKTLRLCVERRVSESM